MILSILSKWIFSIIKIIWRNLKLFSLKTHSFVNIFFDWYRIIPSFFKTRIYVQFCKLLKNPTTNFYQTLIRKSIFTQNPRTSMIKLNTSHLQLRLFHQHHSIIFSNWHKNIPLTIFIDFQGNTNQLFFDSFGHIKCNHNTGNTQTWLFIQVQLKCSHTSITLIS